MVIDQCKQQSGAVSRSLAPHNGASALPYIVDTMSATNPKYKADKYIRETWTSKLVHHKNINVVTCTVS